MSRAHRRCLFLEEKFSGAEESHPSLAAETSVMDEKFPMQRQKFQDYVPVG